MDTKLTQSLSTKKDTKLTQSLTIKHKILPESFSFAITSPRVVMESELMDDRKDILYVIDTSKVIGGQIKSFQFVETRKAANMEFTSV